MTTATAEPKRSNACNCGSAAAPMFHGAACPRFLTWKEDEQRACTARAA